MQINRHTRNKNGHQVVRAASKSAVVDELPADEDELSVEAESDVRDSTIAATVELEESSELLERDDAPLSTASCMLSRRSAKPLALSLM